MQQLHHILEDIAVYIDLIGIAIVLYGFVRASVAFLRAELGRLSTHYSMANCHRIRIELGTYILIAIEFMIASDLIHTVLSRELRDLAFVSALVIIRTAISFFLGREVAELQHTTGERTAL
ncbi:MAG: DUF1622 domain-containing protein [Pseudomonadota bacterium]